MTSSMGASSNLALSHMQRYVGKTFSCCEVPADFALVAKTPHHHRWCAAPDPNVGHAHLCSLRPTGSICLGRSLCANATRKPITSRPALWLHAKKCGLQIFIFAPRGAEPASRRGQTTVCCASVASAQSPSMTNTRRPSPTCWREVHCHSSG